MKYKLYYGKTTQDWWVLAIKSVILCTITFVSVGLFLLSILLVFSL